MEEPSTLSVATTNQSDEVSDSNSCNIFQFIGINHPIQEAGTCHPRFKGVVSQQNGHWERIWLGSFKTEKEAAMAYDSAAVKLRDGDSQRNFPLTEITIREPNFQRQFNTEEILSAIKDGSYAVKLRMQIPQEYPRATFNGGGTKMRELFRKELTPSDVSKLNRLVIPKKYAVKYFPPISEVEEGGNEGGGLDDVELVFFDRSRKSWKFRYCYWKSSQSFVFTRGWNRFAKEKGLRAKDRVIFSLYECNDGLRGIQKMFIIDVAYNDDRETMDGVIDDEMSLQLEIGLPGGNVYGDGQQMMNLKRPNSEAKVMENGNDFGNVDNNVGFKLFGVHIV